ncbi:MAG: CvpA family protein [Bacteroidota bacterium]
MMSIVSFFWLSVFLFAIVGWMRGWAKELLVSFSAILALGLNYLLIQYVPFISSLPKDDVTLFWIQTIILLVLVYFGYQTVSLTRLAGKAVREKIQDSLFGGILGAFNGYLIVGSILYWMDIANYPFPDFISAPTEPVATTVNQMMAYMPPELFGVPGIYFAIILAFIFVLVVYI